MLGRERMKGGSITVFLALLLGSMTALVCAGMVSVQMACARTQIQNGVDVGLFSLFGEYDRQLLENYELFFLDAGDSSGEPDLAAVYGEFRKYMDPILDQNHQELVPVQGGFTGYRLAVDEGGEVLYQQVMAYMRECRETGIRIPDLPGEIDSSELSRLEEKGRETELSEYFARYEEALFYAAEESRKAAAVLQEQQDEVLTDGTGGPDPTRMEFRDPLLPVVQLKEQGLKALLLPSERFTGEASSPTGTILSRRPPRQGMSVFDSLVPDESEEGNELFTAYILEKMSCFPESFEGFPAFQMEYILFGELSDEENMEAMAEKLFLLREGVNLNVILSDASMREKIRAITDWICESYLVPPDEETVEQAVRYAWIFGESLLEARLLLEGERIPWKMTTDAFFLSPDEPWILPEKLRSLGRDWSGTGEGVQYKELLALCLKEMKKEEKLSRTMDVIEQVRRKTEPCFCLDACVSDLEIFIKVQANLKKTFEVRRIYGYSGGNVR